MNESFNHAGAWGITLIVIVLVSWFFYRYFAPKNWREWAGAGVVQAFIIALYAEMYGFPLTIYLLVRFFGLDSEYVSASLWSTLLGIGETGMLISMILGYAIAFLGIRRAVYCFVRRRGGALANTFFNRSFANYRACLRLVGST